MLNNRFRTGLILAGGTALAGNGQAQVPDLLNAFDAGGRSLGMAGSLHATEPSTLSSFYNPASLGFIRTREVGLDYRDLPKSKTAISNSLTDRMYSTTAHSGGSTITHLGFATPLSDLIKHAKGTIALSYTVGGVMNDASFGPASGLQDGSIIVQNYQLNRNARGDYLTLAYGAANPSQTASLGVGITYVQEAVGYVESGSAVDSSGNPVLFPGADIHFTAHGVGFLIGGQVIPAKSPNFSLGASLRSPIQLSNTGPGGIYDRIPARFLAGASYRRDDLWGGNDYLLLGAQFQYFFDGKSSLAFDRSTQTDFGFGAEYSRAFSDWRIPIRIGYEAISSGGASFGTANALTYGIGARPLDNRFSVDLNWVAPQRGGHDFGLSASYRFKQ